MASTTLMAFLLQTPRDVTSVHLVGSWDNFQKPYPMKKDVNLGSGHWRGCHSFTGIICDGYSVHGAAEERDGGLLMGGRYWYFYQLDDDLDYHDPLKVSTTSCPFLPGQVVNVLDVPMQDITDEETSLGRYVSSPSSLGFTLNPEDKYRTPKPPTPVGQPLHSRPSQEDLVCDGIKNDVTGIPLAQKSHVCRRKRVPTSWGERPKNEKPVRPLSEPLSRGSYVWPALDQNRRCQSTGHTRADERRRQEILGPTPGYVPSPGRDVDCDDDALFQPPNLQSCYDSDTLQIIDNGRAKASSDNSSMGWKRCDTGRASPSLNRIVVEGSRSKCDRSWLIIGAEETDTASINHTEGIEEMTNKFNKLDPRLDVQGVANDNDDFEDVTGDALMDPTYRSDKDVFVGSASENCRDSACANDTGNIPRSNEIVLQSSSVSSARTSGLFSSLSSGGYAGCIVPPQTSQPNTPTASEPGEFVLETAYASPQADTEDQGYKQTEHTRTGFIGYSLPEVEYASVLTLRNLETATSRSSRGEISHFEPKTRKQIVEAWNDGSEHHKTALQELVDDLGYLGTMIA